MAHAFNAFTLSCLFLTGVCSSHAFADAPDIFSLPYLHKTLYEEPNERLQELGLISDVEGSLVRTFFSPAHKIAAQKIAEWMRSAGLTVTIDRIGNVRGRLEGADPKAPAIVLGSHYDTVIDGGKYDGVLGIIAAISAVELVSKQQAEGGFKLKHPIEVVAFTDEEGVRFQTTFLGSKALSGALVEEGLLSVRDANGITLEDVLKIDGWPGNEGEMEGLEFPKGGVKSYVEVHSEQGPKLRDMGVALGAVSGIAGQTRLQVSMMGDQNHAGTVPLNLRKDALAGAAEAIYKIEQICRQIDSDNLIDPASMDKDACQSDRESNGLGCKKPNANNSMLGAGKKSTPSMLVCTVGQISVWPGASNVIPGAVNFTVDVRSGQDTQRQTVITGLYDELEDICSKRNLMCSIEKRHEAPAVACDADITAKLVDSIVESQPVLDMILNYNEQGWLDWNATSMSEKKVKKMGRGRDVPVLVSGAGHDTLAMAEIGPVGMMFVRDNGVSHSPKEHVDSQDVAAATVALYKFLEREVLGEF